MNRNLEAIGLLVMALALSAVLATGASAQFNHKWTTTASQTAYLTVEGEGTPVIRPDTEDPDTSWGCDKFKATGSFKNGAEEVTITPKELFECHLIIEKKEFSHIVDFNGCDYRFKSTTTSGNPTGGEHANFEIVCPPGEEIELQVSIFKFKCLTIPPQEVTDAARYDYEETANKATDVTVQMTAHNVRTKRRHSIYCPTEGAETIEYTNGLYTGNFRFAGFKDIEHKEPTSISAGGELVSRNHDFGTAGASKAYLTTEAEGTQIFTPNTEDAQKRFSCNKVNFAGEMAKEAKEITVTPAYSECKAIQETEKGKSEAVAFFEFEKCDYRFHGETVKENPTGGEHAALQIDCNEGEEGIEVKVTAFKLKCLNIYPQVITDAVRYKNVATEGGKVTDITIEVTSHSIESLTLNTAACPEFVENTNGLFTGNITMKGFQDAAHTNATSVST